MPTLNPTMDTRLYVNNGATWAAARDGAAGSNIPTNPTRQSQAVRVGTSAGPTNFDVNRTFFCFDTSGITSRPSSATFRLYGYLNTSADQIVVMVQQAATGGTGAQFVTGDFDKLQGFVAGSTMAGNVRTYSTQISTWATSAYNDITLTGNALDDMVTYSEFKLAILEHDHDFVNSAPTGAVNINAGFYFRNGTYKPELVYTIPPVETLAYGGEWTVEATVTNIGNTLHEFEIEVPDKGRIIECYAEVTAGTLVYQVECAIREISGTTQVTDFHQPLQNQPTQYSTRPGHYYITQTRTTPGSGKLFVAVRTDNATFDHTIKVYINIKR